MKKSVAIIGKGPSVRYSTKDFIDSFDEVAICNFPPMENYQHLISNRATYHFLNAGAPFPYERDFLNNLGLRRIFNTSRDIVPPQKSFIPNHQVIYFEDYGVHVKKRYEDQYGFWPSTGVMAFDYFLNSPDHDTISLVGFDFFQPRESVYYFLKNETNPSLHYLWDNNTYSKDGKMLSTSAHGGDKAKNTVMSLIAKSDKEITFKEK